MLLQRQRGGEAHTPLEPIVAQLKQAVAVTRTLITELNPPILATEGLPDALAWLAEHMQQMYGLRVSLDVSAAREPRDAAVRTLLVQLVREALFNVVKHARTDTARVVLAQSGSHLQVQIEDQGIGFNGSAVLAAAGVYILEVASSLPPANAQLGLCHDYYQSAPGDVTCPDLHCTPGRGYHQ